MGVAPTIVDPVTVYPAGAGCVNKQSEEESKQKCRLQIFCCNDCKQTIMCKTGLNGMWPALMTLIRSIVGTIVFS